MTPATMTALWLILAAAAGALVGCLIGWLAGAQRAKRLEGLLEGEKRAASQLRAEREALTAEHFRHSETALRETNRRQLDDLLRPIRDEFAALQQRVADADKNSQSTAATLRTVFEQSMQQFAASQRQTVADLAAQTDRVSREASDLARVIKGDNKLQGNWGEMLLKNLLKASGLREGEEFFTQEARTDDEGRKFQPDVLVRLPGKGGGYGEVVIDCKVSLKAYERWVNAHNEAERRQALREHVASVRQHVRELADKHYQDLTRDQDDNPLSVGFVFMFMPVEGSYIAAINADADLALDAYRSHVVILSQTNLMSALKLIYLGWQQERQEQSREKIVKSAEELYDKVADFAKSFAEVGDAITRLSDRYTTASRRLSTGPGNVLRRVEKLSQLGLTPRKRIPRLPNADPDSDDDSSSDE